MRPRLQRESLGIEDQRVSEQETAVRFIAHILRAPCLESIQHVDRHTLRERISRRVIASDLQPCFMDESGGKNRGIA